MMSDASKEYKLRFDRYTGEMGVVDKKIKMAGNLRLAIFVIICFFAILLFRAHEYYWLTSEIIAGCILFIAVMFWHNDLYRRRFVCSKSLQINKMGLQRLDGTWGEFSDTGEKYVDHEHPFTWDLDVFGKHSVYQYLCACHTYTGQKKLAYALSCQEKNAVEIKLRQQAVMELAPLIDWRQKYELYGLLSATGNDPEKFLNWCEDGVQTFKYVIVKKILRALPFASLVIGLAGLVLTQTLVFFAIMYSLHLLIFAITYIKMSKIIDLYEKNGSLLLAFSQLIETIETQAFGADYLSTLKSSLVTGRKHSASRVLNSLSRVLSASEIRSNPLGHFIANAVWLWDIQCVLGADRIKHDYGSAFRGWIETAAWFEMLSSLSIAYFENPDWVFPEIDNSEMRLSAKGIGHPLLDRNARVANDIILSNAGEVAIITGSNMSGKSTFLRSVGLNAVLGYAGGAVCAQHLKLPVVNVYTSMRISDDLSSKVSTFYAELLRIGKVVEAVKHKEPVLFLLDELFRGTNSQDRHDGAVAVLKKLSMDRSLGIISTHDLELCNMAADEPERFVNYHFEEHYESDSIAFDYRLKKGQSTTRNAMFLIRMIGIES